MSQSDVVKPGRRHDLDALRAFAMLLGIVLHVGSAFTPTGALGRDSSSAPWFGHAIGLIHGFRMQLFFVVSGFFTMMILRRRGTWALSRQRGLRIALPLLLGLFTIIPAADWAAEWASQRQKAAQPTPAPTLAAAVQSRDAGAIQTLLGDPAQLDRPDPVRGVTPLGWAVLNNDLATARLLLDRGARVVRAGRVGNTPLHYAALLGRLDMTQLLLQQGAKPNATNGAGQTATAMADCSWDETRFAAYSAGTRAGDRETVEAGRQQIRQLLAQAAPAPAPAPTPSPATAAVTQVVKAVRAATRPAIQALAQTRPAPTTAPLAQAAKPARPVTRPATQPRPAVSAASTKPAPPKTPAQPAAKAPAQPPAAPDLAQRYMSFLSSPAFRIWVNDEPIQLFTTGAFHHLWFLWFLCWLTPGLMVAVWATDALALRIPASLVTSPLCLLWLIPVTLLPQWFMRHPTYLFGPETSTGWLPMPHVLLFYAIFFGFGAMCYACGGLGSAADSGEGPGVGVSAGGPAAPVSRWRDLTRWWWLLLPLALAVAYPVGQVYSKSRAITSITITVYGWLMIFGMIGLFRAVLKREHKSVRYLSDASYWLYLTHLMPIAIAQSLVRESSMAAPWKFLLICVAISLGLLIVYDLLVRYSFIGAMLNGRKKRPPLFRRSSAAAERQFQPNAS